MRRTQKIFGKIDGITIILYLLLVFFGWINIYASMYNDDVTTSIFDISTKYGRQLLFILGSLFLGFVAILPAFAMASGVNTQFAQFFGGTSLLIMVGVVLDTLQHIESNLLMRHYDGLMEKGKIKGKSSGTMM